jgi:hypothetical protein
METFGLVLLVVMGIGIVLSIAYKIEVIYSYIKSKGE